MQLRVEWVKGSKQMMTFSQSAMYSTYVRSREAWWEHGEMLNAQGLELRRQVWSAPPDVETGESRAEPCWAVLSRAEPCWAVPSCAKLRWKVRMVQRRPSSSPTPRAWHLDKETRADVVWDCFRVFDALDSDFSWFRVVNCALWQTGGTLRWIVGVFWCVDKTPSEQLHIVHNDPNKNPSATCCGMVAVLLCGCCTNFDTLCCLFAVHTWCLQVDDVTYQLQNSRIRCTSMHGGGKWQDWEDWEVWEDWKIRVEVAKSEAKRMRIDSLLCWSVERILDFRCAHHEAAVLVSAMCVSWGVSQSQRDRALRDLKTGRAHVLTPSTTQYHPESIRLSPIEHQLSIIEIFQISNVL